MVNRQSCLRLCLYGNDKSSQSSLSFRYDASPHVQTNCVASVKSCCVGTKAGFSPSSFSRGSSLCKWHHLWEGNQRVPLESIIASDGWQVWEDYFLSTKYSNLSKRLIPFLSYILLQRNPRPTTIAEINGKKHSSKFELTCIVENQKLRPQKH